MIATTTDAGQRVRRRLNQEVVGWFTTVRRDGQPQPVPVWFLWQADETLLIFSQPQAQKLRNIRHNPKTAFNLNSDGEGHDVVRVDGMAEIVEGLQATDVPAYIEKYRERIANLGITPQGFVASYSVAVRVRPVKVIAY